MIKRDPPPVPGLPTPTPYAQAGIRAWLPCLSPLPQLNPPRASHADEAIDDGQPGQHRHEAVGPLDLLIGVVGSVVRRLRR
jgi:hypothetical protein